MPLLLSGRGFRRELESAGCMAMFAPLEGGAETRLLRRLEAMLGSKPVALWLLEGQVLSRSELSALCDLCRREPRLKVVVEMGGSRSLRWQPMKELLSN